MGTSAESMEKAMKAGSAPDPDGDAVQRGPACRSEEHYRDKPLAGEIRSYVGYPGPAAVPERKLNPIPGRANPGRKSQAGRCRNHEVADGEQAHRAR